MLLETAGVNAYLFIDVVTVSATLSPLYWIKKMSSRKGSMGNKTAHNENSQAVTVIKESC